MRMSLSVLTNEFYKEESMADTDTSLLSFQVYSELILISQQTRLSLICGTD